MHGLKLLEPHVKQIQLYSDKWLEFQGRSQDFLKGSSNSSVEVTKAGV